MEDEKTLKRELDQQLSQLPEDQLREVLDFVESLRRASSGPASIEEKIAARLADVPDEALDALPTDASENLDHYVYGAPKK
jgi:hypothetical protein